MPVTTQDIQLPSMSPGTRRSLVVHRYGTPGAGPKAYFHAALHADELPAILALHHLMPKLEAAQAQGRIRGEIVVVPVANPIGIGQVVGSYFTGRFDLATRENYNRGFGPDWAELAERVKDRLGGDAEANKSLIRAAAVAYCAEQAPATELEALRWKLLELSVDADLVFDCHCAAESLLYLVVYKECLDIGGRDLADAIGSDATFIMDWYADKRTFMTTVGALWPAVRARAPAGAPVPQGCVTATLEYRGRLDVDDRLGADDAERLYRFLVRRGVIDDEPGPVPAPVRAPVATSHMEKGHAPCAGIVTYARRLGERVRAGDVVAHVIDPYGTDPALSRHPVAAPCDGFLYMFRSDRIARPGSTVFWMVADAPQPRRAGRAPQED